MHYKHVEIVNARTGFRTRLEVGSRYKGFEVLQIQKVEVLSGELKLSPESAAELFGTYQLLLRGPEGNEYELANNQAFGGHCFCINRTALQIDLVPGAICPLAYNSNEAQFQHPCPA